MVKTREHVKKPCW